MRGEEAVKEIIRLLEKVEGSGRRASEIFEDWVALVEATLVMLPEHALSMAETGKMAEDPPEIAALWEQMRKRYNPEHRYFKGKKGYFDLFAEAYRILHAFAANYDFYPGLDADPTGPDIIGTVYMLYGHPSKRRGQFFTPWSVASLMGQMLISDGAGEVHERLKQAAEENKNNPLVASVLLASLAIPKGEVEAQEEHFFTRVLPVLAPRAAPVTVYDPCVGSGIMLLAAAAQYPPWAVNSGLVQFYGQDIDALCVQMCHINMMLYGLDSRYLRCALELTAAELDALPQIPATETYREAKKAHEAGDDGRVAEIAAELRAGVVSQLPLFPEEGE